MDELDGIATCYNLIYRRPVGQHVILTATASLAGHGI